MLGSGMNLITTVIGFGMSTTFIMFICIRLLCGRMRSSDSLAAAGRSPDAFDLELQSEPEQPDHSIHGLEPVVVASIPSIKYNKETFQSREDAQCSICLGDYQEKEVLRVMPDCHHSFHLVCIDAWLQKQSTCPICRVSLQDLKATKYTDSTLPRGSLQTSVISDVLSERAQQWLLPSVGSSGIADNNHEIHETLQVILVELPEDRR